jgi:DNA-binding MarR family transcriptional regulator
MAENYRAEKLFQHLLGALEALEGRLASPEEGLGATETLLLAQILDRPPERPSTLAYGLNVSRGRMTQIVGHLEELDLILRLPDRDDQRACRISLSAQGRLAAERARKRVSELEATVRMGLGRAGEAMVHQQLQDIAAKLGD